MLTCHAITRRADADGVDAAIVERDYILAHVVAQLHRATPKDGGTLVFKGGTALRFIHIGDYRYSADLDFTVIKEMWDRRLRHLATCSKQPDSTQHSPTWNSLTTMRIDPNSFPD